MKQGYESLFESYSLKYDTDTFTQGTLGECNYIEREIALIEISAFWILAVEQGGIPLN
jgi:hypothetical protein